MEELKPCPFCGAQPVIRGDIGLEMLVCPTEDCAASEVYLPAYRADRRRESLAKWNRRAPVSEDSPQ